MNGWKKTKKVLLDVVSFNNPQVIFFNLFLVLLILAIIPTSVLSNSPSRCVFKTIILPIVFHGHCPTSGYFIDCNCPACGLTRGMSRLLHGDLAGAYAFNRMVFAVFGIIVVLIIQNFVLSVQYYRRNGRIYSFA
jgi:hypothetical protein